MLFSFQLCFLDELFFRSACKIHSEVVKNGEIFGKEARFWNVRFLLPVAVSKYKLNQNFSFTGMTRSNSKIKRFISILSKGTKFISTDSRCNHHGLIFCISHFAVTPEIYEQIRMKKCFNNACVNAQKCATNK